MSHSATRLMEATVICTRPINVPRRYRWLVANEQEHTKNEKNNTKDKIAPPVRGVPVTHTALGIIPATNAAGTKNVMLVQHQPFGLLGQQASVPLER